MLAESKNQFDTGRKGSIQYGTRPLLEGRSIFCTLKREYTSKIFCVRPDVGQGNKSTGWMPWYQQPMKDVARLRKASVSCPASLAGDLRMGQPAQENPEHSLLCEREPGELKHLSNSRKRNQKRFP